MRRREFLVFLGSAAAGLSVAAFAQTSNLARIGVLMPYPSGSTAAQARMRDFREELRKRGWAAGVNVLFEEHWPADNMESIRSSAAALAALKPDVILAVGGRVIPILIAETRTIPIVIPGASEPVQRGYVQSLANPGGNVTGFALAEISVVGKMLQILKEIAPQLTHVTILYNPDNPGAGSYATTFVAAAQPLRVEPTVAHVHGISDIERTVAAVAAKAGGGIIIASDVTIEALAEQTVALIERYGLPAIYPQRSFVAQGGLVYYGIDRGDLYRYAAAYVDRILRGEKPGNLPFQQPTNYQLVINLKTAKSLGLSIPPRLLFSADDVIE